MDVETISPVTAAGGEVLFYKPQYKLVFKAIDTLNIEGEDINQLTVIKQLRKDGNLDKSGGEAFIHLICGETVSTAFNNKHIEELKEKLALRQLLNLSTTIRNNSVNGGNNPTELVSYIETQLIDIKVLIENKKLNTADAIIEWISVTDGDYFMTELDKELKIVTDREKTNRRKIIQRLKEEGIIEKASRKRGHYRRIDADLEKINWMDINDKILDIKYPFNIENYVETMPGNIIVIAGEQNAGKTAILLNFIKMNMNNFEVHYFNSEMGALEMRKRHEKFDIPLNQWKFFARERSSDFADVIKPASINVIDFLEIHDEFYKIGSILKEIHDKLEDGIAVIALQKNSGTDHGLGGARGLEKPRLYLAMEPGKLKIVKAKNWKTETNPNNMEIEFKLVQGCKFIPDDSGWVYGGKSNNEK